MKNNVFGYLFIIFIIGIMVFAVYRVKVTNSGNKGEENTKASSVATKEKGTELTLGISGLDTINPIITKNKNVQDITKLVFEPLINITESGKLEGCLASEWATTDSKTYIIKLKTGIKWTDGTILSSNDVKYTIDRLKDTGKSSAYADCVRYVDEVDIIDNTAIRIILSRVVPFYEYYLNFPILSSKYYGDDNFWKTKKNKAPITTGQFKISEVTGSTIILTKNENWWNKEKEDSVIEKINLNLYSSVAELYNAFKLGRIDLIATENQDYKKYIGTIGYNTADIEGRKFAYIAMNTKNQILSDVNVRKAIRASINKNELISKNYGKMYTTSNFPLTTYSYLIKREEENYYNIEDVKNNLASSGWQLRNNIWQKTINYKTTKLELNLVVRKKDSKRVKSAEYIKDNLENQGIIINIIKASDKVYEQYLNNKNYDMIFCENTMSITPSVSTFFSQNNFANFSNDEVSEIMSYINNITDENELKEKYQKLYEIYNNEVPYIGIARSKITIVTNSYLSGEINARWYNLFFGFKEWYTS